MLMSLRLTRLALTTAGLLALAGCHSIVPPNLRPPAQNQEAGLDAAKKKLNDASACCTTFADFSFQDMLPPEPRRFVVNDSSPVANLNGDRSYFLAFRLPTTAKQRLPAPDGRSPMPSHRGLGPASRTSP